MSPQFEDFILGDVNTHDTDLPIPDLAAAPSDPENRDFDQHQVLIHPDLIANSGFVSIPADPDMGWTGQSRDQNAISSDVSCIRQVAELNVRLFEHADKLPPLPSKTATEHNTSAVRREGSSADPWQSGDSETFPIDQTFHLTRAFMDMLCHFYPRPKGSANSPPSSSDPPNQPNMYPTPSTHDQTNLPQVANPPAVDRGTALLILSCYHRLIDIYEGIFGHARACIKHKVAPKTADGKSFRLPQMQIGSYVPPESSALAMEMLLMIQMSSQLFDQMREILSRSGLFAADPRPGEAVVRAAAGQDIWRTAAAAATDEAGGQCTQAAASCCTIESAYEDMEKRATRMAENIAGTRQLLLQSGAMSA